MNKFEISNEMSLFCMIFIRYPISAFSKRPQCIIVLINNLQTLCPNSFQQFVLAEILTNGNCQPFVTVVVIIL